jgi:hypothetical protein
VFQRRRFEKLGGGSEQGDEIAADGRVERHARELVVRPPRAEGKVPRADIESCDIALRPTERVLSSLNFF